MLQKQTLPLETSQQLMKYLDKIERLLKQVRKELEEAILKENQNK